MKVLAILILVTGFSTLAWLSERRGTLTGTPEADLPTSEFMVSGLPHGTAEIRRILEKWAIRHYVDRHDDFRIDWELQGESVAADVNEDSWMVRPIVVFYEYPKTGNEAASTVVFQAEGGRYTKAAKAVHLFGNVETRTSDGSTLSAEDLDSTLDKKVLRTDGQVHLRRAGMDLRGTGYQSDSQLTHLVFERDVKAELSGAGGPSLPRPRGEAPKAPVRIPLASTVITCGQGMVFDKTSQKGETGPIRSHATFAGGVQLLRDVPGGTGMRLACDSLETFLVEEKHEGKGVRTTLEKLVARGRVHLEDAEGAMDCDLLLVERKSPTLEVLTLSGPLQRISARRAGALAPMSAATEGAPSAQGPMEAGCLGPLVIERDGVGKKGRSKVFLRQGVTLAQSGSLVQADEMDLLLTPPEKGGQAEVTSFAARGHVFLASEAKVALAERLDWDRAQGVTRLSGGTGVEVVEADRRIHARELTLTQGQKGEKVLATGGVRIETQDLTATGAQLDADPSQDRMVIVGPPDVEVVQTGSTIRCKRFTLRHDERRMMAEDDVRIHFVDDPANKQASAKSLAPVLPGAAPKPGEKREGDLSCDYQEFSWREDGAMDRMVSAGHVVVVSAGTRAEGRTFDWDATKGEGVIEAAPFAVATTTPQKEGADPATFRGRRIRFTSAGRIILHGPKEVEMVREVEDEAGKKTKEPVTAVCERDLVVLEGGKEIHLEKEVWVQSGTTSIRCDSMRVFTDADTNEIKRLLAFGDIRYRSDDRTAFARQMEWEPTTQATDLRSLPPAVMVDPDGRLLYAEHISITNHGKNEVAENEYRRRNIWLPGEKKK